MIHNRRMSRLRLLYLFLLFVLSPRAIADDAKLYCTPDELRALAQQCLDGRCERLVKEQEVDGLKVSNKFRLIRNLNVSKDSAKEEEGYFVSYIYDGKSHMSPPEKGKEYIKVYLKQRGFKGVVFLRESNFAEPPVQSIEYYNANGIREDSSPRKIQEMAANFVQLHHTVPVYERIHKILETAYQQDVLVIDFCADLKSGRVSYPEIQFEKVEHAYSDSRRTLGYDKDRGAIEFEKGSERDQASEH